jgi:hypothetical protein
MGVPADTSGIFARYVDGWWEDPQPTALSFLAGDTDELDDQWPRAGALRGPVAHRRVSDLRKTLRLPWPTPTARLGDPRRGPPSRRVAQERLDEGRRNLDDAVAVYPGWPTPTTQDAKNDGPPSQQDRNMRPLNAMAVTYPEGEEVAHDAPKTPLLNAVFVELLMGFGEGWTSV